MKRERLTSLERQVEEDLRPAKQKLIVLEQTRTEFVECEKELRATIERLQIQLEESQRNQGSGRPVLELEVERLKFEYGELKRENNSLRKAGDSFMNAMQQVASLKKELEQAQERLSRLHSDHHHINKNEPNNNQRDLMASLNENIQKERSERIRLEKDNLRLIEKIRLMNTRRSISEAESQIDLSVLRKVTMNGLFRTAFVNGSKTKKLVSFYFLFIHALLVYKLFF